MYLSFRFILNEAHYLCFSVVLVIKSAACQVYACVYFKHPCQATTSFHFIYLLIQLIGKHWNFKPCTRCYNSLLTKNQFSCWIFYIRPTNVVALWLSNSCVFVVPPLKKFLGHHLFILKCIFYGFHFLQLMNFLVISFIPEYMNFLECKICILENLFHNEEVTHDL